MPSWLLQPGENASFAGKQGGARLFGAEPVLPARGVPGLGRFVCGHEPERGARRVAGGFAQEAGGAPVRAGAGVAGQQQGGGRARGQLGQGGLALGAAAIHIQDAKRGAGRQGRGPGQLRRQLKADERGRCAGGVGAGGAFAARGGALGVHDDGGREGIQAGEDLPHVQQGFGRVCGQGGIGLRKAA